MLQPTKTPMNAIAGYMLDGAMRSLDGFKKGAYATVNDPPPVTPYQGLDHFGLLVSGIDAVVAELKAKGAEFSREPTTVRPGVRVAFLRAPQGVSIELLDRNAA